MKGFYFKDGFYLFSAIESIHLMHTTNERDAFILVNFVSGKNIHIDLYWNRDTYLLLQEMYGTGDW